MATVIKIPISEGANGYHDRYKKLSARSRVVMRHMGELYRATGESAFSMDDFRGKGLGTWRQLRDAFYELESRNLGSVIRGRIGVGFNGSEPALQAL
jgi:hypothetical protein